MAEYTIEDYKRGARAAHAAGDIEAAKRLIAAARALDGTQPTTPNQPAEPDTSLSGAFGYGVDNAQRIIGKGIQSAGELSGIQSVEDYGAEVARANQEQLDNSNYQRPEGADGIVKNLREGDYADAGRSLLYGSVEAAPQVGAGVAASVGAGLAATTAPIIGTGLAVGGTLAGTTMALGANRDEKEQQGLDPTATATDLASAIASGLVELLPIKGGGATLKVIKEGLQEAGQEGLIIGGTAVQGGEYVTQDVIDRIGDAAAIGATVAGTANVGITTVSKTGEKVLKPRESLDPETDQAAGDVARMFQDIATDEGLNIKDVDPSSQKGANAVLNAARSKLREEIDANYKILSQEVLKSADQATKSKFQETLRQARNKVSTTVTKENLDFVKNTVGNTKEGQALLNALRRSNIVTEVYSGGLKGGISQFTDTFNPLPSFGRSFNPAGMIAGNINTGAAFATGGQSLAVQIPTVIAGRTIDAITGRRSKLNTFIKKNRKKDGLEDPTGVAVEGRAARLKAAQQAQAKARAQAAKDAADAAKAKNAVDVAAANVRMYKLGEYPIGQDDKPSPRLAVYQAIEQVKPQHTLKQSPTDTDGEIARILAEEAMNTKSAERRRNIQKYFDILESGKADMEGKPLNEVISIVKTAMLRKAMANPQPTPPTSPTTPTQGGQTPIPVSPMSAKLADGKNANIAFLASLRAELDADTKVSSDDRAVLSKALDELGMNLGSDPVFKATEIVDGARVSLSSMALADKYLVPYLNRVKMQQAAAIAKTAKAKAKAQKPNDQGPNTTTPATPTQTVGSSGSGNAGQPVGGVQSGPVPLAQSGQLPNTPVAQDPTPTQDPKPLEKPTTAKVKKNLPEAKAIIEIGKKGSKYENGIQDVQTALEVAQLLGISAQLMNSGTALQKATKSGSGVMGVHSWSATMKGFGSKVFGIRPKGSFNGKPITSIRSLQTMLHEMGHALTQGNLDGKGEFGIAALTNKVTGQTDVVGKHSYNNSVMKPILEGLGPDHPAIKEIHAFQEAGKAYIESNPTETTAPRQSLTDLLSWLDSAERSGDKMEIDYYKRRLKDFRSYTSSAPELSVDPMWLYLMNPRLANELMPINSKLIRDEFAKANNGKILFYSHPFATILAVIMSMGLLAAAGGDQEEEQNKGILSA